MQLEIGTIHDGKVKSITAYGAFVDIEGHGSGMVHISEIANTYVNEIRDHVTEGQEVKVKVIGVNEQGKVSLSIKKAAPAPEPQPRREFSNNRHERHEGGGQRPPQQRNNRPSGPVWNGEKKQAVPAGEMTFEDMMSRFKQDSEKRMCDLKRGTDRKNGSRRK